MEKPVVVLGVPSNSGGLSVDGDVPGDRIGRNGLLTWW